MCYIYWFYHYFWFYAASYVCRTPSGSGQTEQNWTPQNYKLACDRPPISQQHIYTSNLSSECHALYLYHAIILKQHYKRPTVKSRHPCRALWLQMLKTKKILVLASFLLIVPQKNPLHPSVPPSMKLTR